MDSFENNIANFNKEIRSVGTALRECGEDPGNLFLQLFVTYADCSLDNDPFTHYIEKLQNKYNDGTLSLESKYLMDKAEVRYNNLKDKLNFKGNCKE